MYFSYKQNCFDNKEVPEMLIQNCFTFHCSFEENMLKDGSMVLHSQSIFLDSTLINRNYEIRSIIL